MAQLPDLIDLYGEFKEKGLRLLGVNIDHDRAAVDEGLGKYDVSWPQYFDGKGFENDILVATGVLNVPTVFVIDREGILRAINSGENLRDLVRELLTS